jgi:hypothetical protein
MKPIIISQYKAALKMLMDVINKCPDDLWDDNSYESPYWHIVYHALFYAAFYSSKGPETFIPWEKHKENYNFLGTIEPDGVSFKIENTYSKVELMDYAEMIFNNMESAVTKLNDDEKCTFYWLPISTMELQLYNIRHLQHHTGQLVERLHQNGIKGINWVGSG